MQIIIDIDGTICTEEKTYSRSMAKPLISAVESVNSIYDKGHTVILYSARAWVEFEMTTDWLKRNGFKYHQLILGKPIGDVWIDDRAISFNGWDNVNKILEKKENF